MATTYLKKAQKAQLIDDIYYLLSAGTDQLEIFAKIHQKAKTTDNNIYRMLKIASERLETDRRAIKTEVMKDYTSAISSRLKTALWTQEEILFKLQNEAKEAKRSADRINAIKLICDIQGFKAPIKQDIEIHSTPIFSENPLIDGINNDHKYLA
jgi:hypothetical protein